jgi:hypothetical protein
MLLDPYLQSLKIDQTVVKWVSNSRLLGVTIDEGLTSSKHLISSTMCLDLYNKVILFCNLMQYPAIWGGFSNKQALMPWRCSTVHKAARIIYHENISKWNLFYYIVESEILRNTQ